MKTPLALVLAASFVLGGCAVFQRSEAWDTVVRSRSEFAGDSGGGAKDGYINHLHQILTNAGIEHKIVTYQFHYRNAYREDSVQTAVGVIYRDDSNTRNPWWIMDEYRNVPVWLPNWPLDAQLEFFLQRDVEVLEENAYVPAERRTAAPRPRRSVHEAVASVPKPRKQRSLFAGSRPKKAAEQSAPALAADADPLTATSLTGSDDDSRAAALFRTSHGTAFDPGSAIDRQKMAALKRQLFSRNRSAQLRNE